MNAFARGDKENCGGVNSQSIALSVGDGDKAMLMEHVFAAMDSAVATGGHKGKVVISSLENVIYNIAQTNFADWSAYAVAQIEQRLSQGEIGFIESGLRALKSILDAFEFELTEERKPMALLVEKFFPIIEQSLIGTLLSDVQYTPQMILVCKIFFITISVSPAAKRALRGAVYRSASREGER